MDKSSHRNFVEWYWRNREIIIRDNVLPYQSAIFDIFSKKFDFDAQKDLLRWRKKLWRLGNSCAEELSKIHSILNSWTVSDDELDEIIEIVENVVDMDYDSVKEFFYTLKKEYSENWKIKERLNQICDNISKMWEISQDKTNIITK